MYYPDVFSNYATLNPTSNSSAAPTGYDYSQYGATSTANQYSGTYQFGANQNQYNTAASHQSQNFNQYGNAQYDASSAYPQYSSTYSASTPASTTSYTPPANSNWDPTTPLSIGGTTTSTTNYSHSGYQSSGNYSNSGYQSSGSYSNSGNQNRGNYSNSGYQGKNSYSGPGNRYSGNNYSSGRGGGSVGDQRATKGFTKVTPFKTDHLYDCPNNGQPIQCTTCDVIMPSYSIASVHFNSPKHHRKRMNQLSYPSEKRKKLAEISETDPDAIKMECALCGVKPGSYDGFLSHMASLKHIKKLNNIGPETKTFNITCEPCDEKINTIEHLSMHVNMKSHMRDVAKKLKELYPDLKDDASQWHCAACNKSCNSMQTFDAHCASVRHRNKVKLFENQKFESEFEQVERADQFEKLAQQSVEVGQPPEEHPAPPPPPPPAPAKPLKIEKGVAIPDMYQCKVCNFGTTEKHLIDKHYETSSHRANKLLKRRHDELYRVADVGKRDHKGVYLGDIVPLNAKGAVRCDICELSFAHQLLLDIHKRGRLHKEMEAKLETEHDKIQSQRIEEAPVGVLASAVKPAPTKPVQKGGHHCDACDVHTSCLTRYLAHVSSRSHRKMMAQLAKSGVPGNEPADSSEKCELRAEALAPPAPKRPVPASWQQPQIQSNSFQANKRTKFGDSMNDNKKKKKKNPSEVLRISDYLHGF